MYLFRGNVQLVSKTMYACIYAYMTFVCFIFMYVRLSVCVCVCFRVWHIVLYFADFQFWIFGGVAFFADSGFNLIFLLWSHQQR